MSKTVLITGTSSGIGLETAKIFHSKGYKVIATMRNPDKRDTELHHLENIDLYHLDVTDLGSCDKAVEYIIKEYGSIDILVNNAGYDLYGALENITMDQIRKQFDTNVLGMIYLTKIIVPYMRKAGQGSIINIASLGGIFTLPVSSMYNSTKFAVEGFSRSIAHELKTQNIKVKVIEPGLINTNFYNTGIDKNELAEDNPYKIMSDNMLKNSTEKCNKGSHPSVVAKTILKAASSKNYRIRYSTGSQAKILLWLHRWVPSPIFRALMYSSMAK